MTITSISIGKIFGQTEARLILKSKAALYVPSQSVFADAFSGLCISDKIDMQKRINIFDKFLDKSIFIK